MDAAERSGITLRTLRRRVHAGELPAVPDPLDRRRLVRLDDLRRLLDGLRPLRDVSRVHVRTETADSAHNPK